MVQLLVLWSTCRLPTQTWVQTCDFWCGIYTGHSRIPRFL